MFRRESSLERNDWILSESPGWDGSDFLKLALTCQRQSRDREPETPQCHPVTRARHLICLDFTLLFVTWVVKWIFVGSNEIICLILYCELPSTKIMCGVVVLGVDFMSIRLKMLRTGNLRLKIDLFPMSEWLTGIFLARSFFFLVA